MSTAVSLIDELLTLYSSKTSTTTQNTDQQIIIDQTDEFVDHTDYNACQNYFTILLGNFANSETHYNIKQLNELKNDLCLFSNNVTSNTIQKLLNEEEIFVDNEYYNDDNNNHIQPLYLFALKMFEESKKLCDYSTQKKDWIYTPNAETYSKCQIYWEIIKLLIHNGANCSRYYEQRHAANANNIFTQIINAFDSPKDKIFASCNKFHDISLLLHILYNWKDYHKRRREIIDEYLEIIWYLIENDNDIQNRSILNICYYEQDSSQILKPAKINGYFLHSSFTSPFVDNVDFHCHDITDPLHETCTNECGRNRNQTTNDNNTQLLRQYVDSLVDLFANDEDEEAKDGDGDEKEEKKSQNVKHDSEQKEQQRKTLLLDSRCMVRDIYCLKKLMYYGYDLIYAVKYDKKNHLLETLNTEQVLMDLMNTDLKVSWGDRFLEKANKLVQFNLELAMEQKKRNEDRSKWTEKRRVFLYIWILRTMAKVIKKEYFNLMYNENTLLKMLPTFEQMEIIMNYVGNNYCKKYEYLFSKIDTSFLILNALNTLSEITIWDLDRVITDYCFSELSDKDLQLIAYKSGLFTNEKTRNNRFKRMCHNEIFMKIYYNYLIYDNNDYFTPKYVPSCDIVYDSLIKRRNNDNICILYGEALNKAKPAYNSYFYSFLRVFGHIALLNNENQMKQKQEWMRKLLLIYQPEYIMSAKRNKDERMQRLLFKLLNEKAYIVLTHLMKYKVLNVMCVLNELRLLKKLLMNIGMDGKIQFLDELLHYLFKNVPKSKTYRRNIAWLRKLCRDNIEMIPKNNRTDIQQKSVDIFQKYCKKTKK